MRDIIYFSSIPWDYFHHRQQEMMEWFSGHGYRVFFWEPNGLTKEKYECKSVLDNIYLLRNRGIRYERCSRAINHLNSLFQECAYRRLLRDFKLNDPIIWFDRIHGIALDIMLSSNACVYDLIDEITAFGRWKNSKMLLSMEGRVLSECELLISSSQTLLNRKSVKTSARTLFIPNGCDAKLLENYRSFRSESTTPVIGFCGAISARRLDLELIESVANRLPNFSFRFVGPRDATAEQLCFSADNITLEDPIQPDDLSELLASFDVGYIPYRLELGSMDYVFPKKAFEYMAAGLPVVSTPLPECVRLNEGIACAGTPEAMVSAIKDAVCVTEAYRERQHDIAKSFTWDSLLPPLLDVLDEMK